MRPVALFAAVWIFGVSGTAAASSITFSGSARVECFGEDAFSDSFLYTNVTSITDSAQMSRACAEFLDDDFGDEIVVNTRSASLDASVSGNVLSWSGSSDGSFSQTDAGALVGYVISDVLTITQTGLFTFSTHVEGTGSGVPNNCFLYSFSANIKLNGSQTPLAPVSITPCGSTTDNFVEFVLTEGSIIPIVTTFSGRVGLSLLDSATFDATHTGLITITSLDGAFTAESGLTYSAPTSVPEPASLLLLGTGLIGVGLRRYRQRRGKS